jgi:hypothetical protein
MMRSLWILAVVLVGLLALAGCSGDSGAASTLDVVSEDGLGQPDGFQGPAPCNTDGDCKSGVCVVALGACLECADDSDCSTEDQCFQYSCIKRPPCLGDQDCTGLGRCDTVAGYCLQCLEDADCGAAPWRCEGDFCLLGCNANRDCLTDLVCDTAAHVCVECLTDEDCPSASFCEAGIAACLPDLCKSGSALCTLGGLAPCRLNGSGWAAAEPCPEGSACKSGKCEAGLLCSPGLGTCKDPATVERCNADGLGFTSIPCGEDKKCDQGDCVLDLCEASCDGRVCGTDGCGGSCGTCGEGQVCDGAEGQCVNACTPYCNNKDCGNDGCGGSCGTCPEGEGCSAFQCVDSLSCNELVECIMGCEGSKNCEDNCWDRTSPEAMLQWLKLSNCVETACGSWGNSCAAKAVQDGGACRKEWTNCLDCTPDCQDRDCGADGCGGSCGTCPEKQACTEAGYCACTPVCGGKECGNNGCGGSCGTCGGGFECQDGLCEELVPSCGNEACDGDEDCASCPDDCGPCAESDCCATHDRPGCEWDFISECVCAQKASCCDTKWGKDCVAKAATCGGDCEVCQPDCEALECGSDGCGGSCGECDQGDTCQDGLCTGSNPDPSCREMFDCAVECGFDDCEEACTNGASDLNWAAYQAIRGCVTFKCGTGADWSCYEGALDGFVCSNLFNLCQ